MSRDRESVFDIIDSINKILTYTSGMKMADFMANDEK